MHGEHGNLQHEITQHVAERVRLQTLVDTTDEILDLLADFIVRACITLGEEGIPPGHYSGGVAPWDAQIEAWAEDRVEKAGEDYSS
jgi:hypothetical protein